MSTNLTTVAQAAAQFLGVLDSGEGLSAQQLSDALAACNNMLDNWSSEGLFALSDLVTTWTLSAGTQGYSIGTAQTINVARPLRIVAAAFTNSAGPGGPIEVVDEKQWAGIIDRQRRSWIIEKLFWDRATGTSGMVYVSPVPLGTLTGEIHTWVPLTQFADTTTGITIPPGYLRMIEFGLAAELAPQYDMVVPASVAAGFSDAAGRVRRLNASLIGDIPPELAAEAK